MEPRRSTRGKARLNYSEEDLEPYIHGFDSDSEDDPDNPYDSDYSAPREKDSSDDVSSNDSEESSGSEDNSEKRIASQYVKRCARVVENMESAAQPRNKKPKRTPGMLAQSPDIYYAR
jgi:hypothetical protein